MTKERTSPYQVLVYIAYGFYMVIWLTWLIISMLGKDHFFNFWAFFFIVVFCVQIYYKHLLTNLILGIILIFVSIFFFWEFLSWLKGEPVLFNEVGVCVSGVSIVLSGILIFSYLNLNFKKP